LEEFIIEIEAWQISGVFDSVGLSEFVQVLIVLSDDLDEKVTVNIKQLESDKGSITQFKF
jgi:hypothetical protein